MGEKRIDPVMGELTFDPGAHEWGGWEKLEHLEVIAAPIELTVSADREGPTERQRSIYRSLKEAPATLRAELQEALLQFYLGEREVYADACADIEDYEENFLPVLQSSEEIWGILTPCLWSIDDCDQMGYTLDGEHAYDTIVFWHGCWDIEHEFGAGFKDGKLAGVFRMGNF